MVDVGTTLHLKLKKSVLYSMKVWTTNAIQTYYISHVVTVM